MSQPAAAGKQEEAPKAPWTMTRKTVSAPQRGFTLIELMIAVAVVGILAGIAYPSYVDHVRRGKIAAALGELSAARVRLEQYYQDHRDYGSTAGGCGVAMPSSPGFEFTCAWGPAGTSQSFLLTASGQGGMAGYAYTVDQADHQVTTQFAGQGMTSACWLKRKGDSC